MEWDKMMKMTWKVKKTWMVCKMDNNKSMDKMMIKTLNMMKKIWKEIHKCIQD